MTNTQQQEHCLEKMSVYLIKAFKMTARWWYIILHSMKKWDNCNYSYQVYQGPLLSSSTSCPKYVHMTTSLNKHLAWRPQTKYLVKKVVMWTYLGARGDFKVTCHKHFNVQHFLIFKNKTVCTLKTSFRRYLSLSCLGTKKY